MPSLLRSLAALALSVPLAAQVGRNRAPDAGQPTFQSTTQLVVETVVVTDKDGKPIRNLTASDFAVTEDGVPQAIKFFEYQELPEAPSAAPLPATLRPAPFARLPHTQVAAAPPGDLRYRGRRLLALYFDFTAMPVPDQLRALDAARQFIRVQMTEADLVAIMAFRSGAVEVFQDFTADRERLLAVIATLIAGEDEEAALDPDTRADTGAAFGQNDAEFNIFFTDRQLAALQTAAAMLGRLNEKKSLVYFASGVRLNGANNQAQLQATINAAIRAGVSFWPVDARGLVAQAPLGDASSGSPGGEGIYTGKTANAMAGALDRSRDTLWTLAADTGGKAFLDSNDLSRGIVQAQRSVSSYYVLGYYPTNPEPDGKFRKVRIALGDGRQAALNYRQGYYAPKVFRRFSGADKERQLEEALMLADPLTELTIAMEIDYFQLNSAEYFVPVTVKIPGSELVRARAGGAERTVIDFIAEIKDGYGATMTNLRDKVDIRLSGATAAELARRPVQYDTGFTLLPGRYRIKFLARDAVTGRIGTYEMPFQVPNLEREQVRVPISSVVLSSQRAGLDEALYNAGKQKGKQAQRVNPLVEDGWKLLPSVTRVFSRTKEMYVYLEAYRPRGESILAFVTFYRGGRKMMESQPMEIAGTRPDRLKTTPIRFRLPLGELAEGEYVCQVSVLDPAGKKAAFWQAPVLVVP